MSAMTGKIVSAVQTVEGVRTCRVRLAPSRRLVQAIIRDPWGHVLSYAEGDLVHLDAQHADLGAGVYVVGKFGAVGESDKVATQAQIDALQAQIDALIWMLNTAANGSGVLVFAAPAAAGGAIDAAKLLLGVDYTTATPATGKGRADADAIRAKSARVEVEGGDG